MKLINFFLIITSSILLISCASTGQQNSNQNRKISSASCLETTYDTIKKNIHLPIPHRYLFAAAKICSKSRARDVDKIITLYKELRSTKYYNYGLFGNGIGPYKELLVAINLNGNNSNVTCLEEKMQAIEDSKSFEFRNASTPNKYIIASELCSN